ncbi:MAG: FapA family protein [Bacillota bacterium]
MQEAGKSPPRQHPAAWVEKGELKVEHGAERPYPVVAPCRGVRLFVNGKEYTTAVVVSKSDAVKIETTNDFIAGSWTLEIASDRMAAFVKLQPARELRRELADLPPSAYLQLQLVETVHPLPPATFEEILDKLKEKNIVFGIDLKACLEAADCREQKNFAVARGQKPVPGQDALIELLFSRESKLPVAIGDVKINFRERYAFNSVEAGAVLARKTPAAPGKPGTNIHGQSVEPPPPKDIALRAGKGVMLVENGLTAVAAQAGRPKAIVKQNEVAVEISPVLVHPGDVDLSSGNISFKGDIFIQGSVGEGMRVEALENVQVGGYVAHATVQAGGSVFIQGNVLSSVIVAGGKQGFMIEGANLLREFSLLTARMKQAIAQLRQNPAFSEKEVARALPILLETKFKEIPEYAKKLAALVNSLPEDAITEELRQLTNSALKAFGGLPVYPEIPAYLESITHLADRLLAEIPAGHPRKGDVRIAYALNSVLKATGDVRVFGDGCFQTTIEAQGSVQVKGVFRGGKIYSRRNVLVGELGSRRGLKTRVVVPEGAFVHLGKVWENAEIQIGKRIHKFVREESNVKVRLDKNKEIAVSYATRSV